MMMLDHNNLAASLKAARDRNGLSLQQLAERCGLELSTLWRIEEGKTRDPASSTLRKIEQALAGEKSA